MTVREEISKWTHGEDWRTWVSHAVVALLIALPLTGVALIFDWSLWLGPSVAAGFYVLRELDQILYRIVDREPLHPFDHFMDAAVPTAVVYLLIGPFA